MFTSCKRKLATFSLCPIRQMVDKSRIPAYNKNVYLCFFLLPLFGYICEFVFLWWLLFLLCASTFFLLHRSFSFIAPISKNIIWTYFRFWFFVLLGCLVMRHIQVLEHINKYIRHRCWNHNPFKGTTRSLTQTMRSRTHVRIPKQFRNGSLFIRVPPSPPTLTENVYVRSVSAPICPYKILLNWPT